MGRTAFNLFVRLFADTNLNFYKGDLGTSPEWWSRHLICEWANADAAYKEIYARAGVTWRKTTHLRTQGIETASREGITEDEIGTLLKHITRKTARYLTELYPPTISTQSGFTKIPGTLFAPRSGLEIPREAEMTPDQLALLLYPQLTRWRAKYQDPRGDHSQAAHNFLYELLPFLAMTIFQDGIYWLRYLPNHQATRLLKQVMLNWYHQR